MEIIRLALDWTPNTIHSGFFLAFHKGWYREAGLEVEFISPETDNYQLTPARRLSQRKVDFAIAPSESVLSYNTSRRPAAITSVASILHRDTSAIVCLSKSGITRPAELDGKIYASYNARYEDEIVRAMIVNDGGTGRFRPVSVSRLGIWDMLKQGEADATWVFMPWEGAEAAHNGITLNAFRMEDFGIPYGYTPLVLAHLSAIPLREKAYRSFLRISARAYTEAANYPDETAAFLSSTVGYPDFAQQAFIRDSMRELAPAILNHAGRWGEMQPQVWGRFIDWLVERKLLVPRQPIESWHLFTNRLLEG